MADLLTIRLDPGTRKRIDRIARRKKMTTSEAARQALEAWAEQEEPGESLYDQMREFIGIAHGGDPTRSTWSSRKIAGLLKDRRRRC